jgi:hypothetical protein
MLSLWALIGWTAPAIVVESPLPDECPVAQAVLARLLDVTPEGPPDPAQGRLRIRITRDADRLQATLTVEHPSQPPAVRTLDGVATDCRALVSAVALTAALIVEPLPEKAKPTEKTPAEKAKPTEKTPAEKAPAEKTSAEKTPAEKTPAEKTPAEKTPAPPAAAATVTPSVPAQRWQTHAGLLVTTGPLPGTSMALDLGMDWLTDDWRAGLSGRVHLALPGDVAEGTVAGQLALIQASGCRRGSRWAACALVGYGLQWLEGADFAANRAADGAYLAVGARGEYRMPLSADWALAAVVEAHAPISRLHLTVDGEPEWSTPAVLGALGADLCFRF